MEKLNLREAVYDVFTANSNVEEISKYINNGSTNIDLHKKGYRVRKIGITISYLLLSFLAPLIYYKLFTYISNLDSSQYLGGFLLLMITSSILYLLFNTLGNVKKEYDALYKVEIEELKNTLLREIIKLHFEHFLQLAQEDVSLVEKVFLSAKELEVPEDKLEGYIKGYIIKENKKKENNNSSRLRKINEVIAFAERPKIVPIEIQKTNLSKNKEKDKQN